MAKNISLVFPGQGAQYVGMGKDFYDGSPAAKKIFERASSRLGQDIAKIIFEGPEEKLKETIYTQPAVFVTSVAMLEALKEKLAEKNINLDNLVTAAAGHSLGEYTALYSAGAFPDFETAIALVSARAGFIQECSVKYPGTMAAILGLDENVVLEVCAEARKETGGVVEAVNFNSPGQIVIAGDISSIEKAMSLATQRKALKVVRLNVSGAFHSPLMKEAADSMSSVLEKTMLTLETKFPVYMNCDATPTSDADGIKKKLAVQIDHPVLWEKTIRNMISQSHTAKFIEIGPGKVLSGLIKRIDRKIPVANLENFSEIDKIISFILSETDN